MVSVEARTAIPKLSPSPATEASAQRRADTGQRRPAIAPVYDVTVYSRETLVQDFVAYMRFEQHLSKYTVRNYQHDLAKLDRFLPPDFPWQDVTRQELRAFLEYLHTRGFALATCRRVTATLRAFYKFLRMEGHMQTNPVEDMPRMRVPTVLPRYLEWERSKRSSGRRWRRLYREGRAPPGPNQPLTVPMLSFNFSRRRE